LRHRHGSPREGFSDKARAMIWLWIAAALVSAGLAALMVQRAARAARATGAENPALAVYRRQMAELDELADRGLLAEGERRSVRAETGRRLLAAAGRADPPLKAARPGLILAAAAAVPIVALIAYMAVGAPGFADQPFAQRLAEWRTSDPQTLSPPQMAAILRVVAAERPNDPEPLHNLALAELASNQPLEAVQALHRALAVAPRRVDLWELLGEASAMQAGGDVDANAQGAFREALVLDPTAPIARYYLARARIAGGDAAGGLADWRALEASFALDDPRRAMLGQEIAQVSAHGRLETPGAPQSGQQVGPQEIQAMVDGLAARLKANPDDPTGWARLVRAYSVLGETDRRDAALAEARQRYAGRPDVLANLDAAAKPESASGAVR
jgi:cytochrome c-type biogenesis protein CcmH